MIFFLKIPKSKMNEKSGLFLIKKCTHSAYFYNILSCIYLVSFVVIYIPIHMFHIMNIFNARKVQHSKVINKNISHKKCKNNPNCQKVVQMAIFHFLRDKFLLINFECCIFQTVSFFLLDPVLYEKQASRGTVNQHHSAY